MVGTQAAAAVKKSRWALLKNPWNLTPRQGEKPREVQRLNRRLYDAYLLKAWWKGSTTRFGSSCAGPMASRHRSLQGDGVPVPQGADAQLAVAGRCVVLQW